MGKPRDVISADYHLDRGTGIDAIKMMRKASRQQIPAIVIATNYPPEAETQIAAEKVGLLQKPIRHVYFLTCSTKFVDAAPRTDPPAIRP
jgi:CheY-like chemotaxis protein